MQGTKVVVGETYAVKRDGVGVLVRFYVKSVTTTRKGKHPTDFAHTVTGWIVEDGDSRKEVHFKPEQLLGPFTEHARLVKAKEAEDAAKKASARAAAAAAVEVAQWLYKTAGLKVPPGDLLDWDARGLIRVSYGRTVEITTEGVAALLAKIRVPA